MKLHLGCGPNVLPGYENLDLNGPIVADLTRPLPYPSGSISHILTEHFIEHLTREDGVRLIGECYRVLAVGGELLISTPDLFTLASDYLDGRTDRGHVMGFYPSSPCEYLNRSTREWGHEYIYDYPELRSILVGAGFSVQQIPHGPPLSRPYLNDLILQARK